MQPPPCGVHRATSANRPDGRSAGAAGTRIGAGTQRQLLLRLSSGGSMDESLRTTQTPYGYAVPSVEQRNRVLRNTYWLLALSMVPTVLGAWLGVATGIVAAMGVTMS